MKPFVGRSSSPRFELFPPSIEPRDLSLHALQLVTHFARRARLRALRVERRILEPGRERLHVLLGLRQSDLELLELAELLPRELLRTVRRHLLRPGTLLPLLGGRGRFAGL